MRYILFSRVTLLGSLFASVSHAGQSLKKPPLRNPREFGVSLRLDGNISQPFARIGLLHRCALMNPEDIAYTLERYEGLSEYLDKFRDGKLSKEEKDNPPRFFYKSSLDDPVASIRSLFELNQEDGNPTKILRQHSKQQKNNAFHFKFDVEESCEHKNGKQRERLIAVENSWDCKYQKICLRLQTWAESFDEQTLQQVKIRKKIIEEDFDLEHQWITAKIHQALDACSYGWLANIIVVTESHDRYETAELSLICESNQKGFWGPLLVVSVDSQAFMYAQEETWKVDSQFLTTLFMQKALSYYSDDFGTAVCPSCH